MTIITKPLTGKKLELTHHLTSSKADNTNKDVAQKDLLIRQPTDVEKRIQEQNENPYFKAIIYVFFTLSIMCMGLIVGLSLYRMWAPTHNTFYSTVCDIPYVANNQSVPRFYARSGDFDFLLPKLNDNALGMLTDDDFEDDRFFREEIEMDLTRDDSYANVYVPDYKEGRQGKFMHDFRDNQSAIIDEKTNRCFIMELDRNTVLPPSSLMDLMKKVGEGYYKINTERVRRTMRVVMPPITDMSLISQRIANTCLGKHVYLLENYVSGVFKREIQYITEAGRFAEYLGLGVVEYDICNIVDIDRIENQKKIN